VPATFAGFDSAGVSPPARDRQGTEAALRDWELRFRSVAQTATDALVTADGGGVILSWNPAAVAMFGYSEREAIGRSLSMLIPARFQADYHDGLSRARPGDQRLVGKAAEVYGRRRNGQEFPLELSLSTWALGEATFHVGSLRDITALEQAETEVVRVTARLEQSERAAIEASRAKSLFLANMSNELRTPLEAITRLARSITLDPDITPDIRESVAAIIRNSDSIANVLATSIEPVEPLLARGGPPVAPAPGPGMRLAPDQPRHRVLVVDSAPDQRTRLARLLASMGFAVEQADDGRAAVELWARWRPALLWMDMSLPVMSGADATRAIRRSEAAGLTGGTPTVIIALTDSPFQHDRDNFLAAGCDDVVSRPFREGSIFEVLQRRAEVKLAPVPAPESPGQSWALTVARLRALPATMREALRSALRAGDDLEALRICDEAPPQEQGLAAAVARMVRTFRLDEVLAMLEKGLPE